jgi:two-component SAPR family response regulator
MKKRVLDVGNCGPDHGSIKKMLQRVFDVDVLQTDQTSDTLALLEKENVDLILVNRKLDVDYSDGVDVISAIKADSRFAAIPVMLVTNMDEYQEQAVKVGAVHGFGKLALNAPETHNRIRDALGIQ